VTTTNLWLDPIPPMLREAAADAMGVGDVVGFLGKAPNDYGLDLVSFNCRALQERGIYEAALFHALTACRVNNRQWPMYELRHMCELADRATLRAAGEPLPGAGPFTVYRGVAGRGSARRVRGLSWTFSLPVAAWFARRSANVFQLPEPAVYRLTVTEAEVLAYANDRREAELLVLCDKTRRPVRCLDGAQLERLAEQHGVSAHAENMARLEAMRVAALRKERDTSSV
jgi:hypothetical protein